MKRKRNQPEVTPEKDSGIRDPEQTQLNSNDAVMRYDAVAKREKMGGYVVPSYHVEEKADGVIIRARTAWELRALSDGKWGLGAGASKDYVSFLISRKLWVLCLTGDGRPLAFDFRNATCSEWGVSPEYGATTVPMHTVVNQTELLAFRLPCRGLEEKKWGHYYADPEIPSFYGVRYAKTDLLKDS
jgi:hypothetical protein